MNWSNKAPPHVGWWNVKISFKTPQELKPSYYWGWWNGEYWSMFAPSNFSAEAAAERANAKGNLHQPNNGVYWNDYWPENARVARIAP